MLCAAAVARLFYDWLIIGAWVQSHWIGLASLSYEYSYVHELIRPDLFGPICCCISTLVTPHGGGGGGKEIRPGRAPAAFCLFVGWRQGTHVGTRLVYPKVVVRRCEAGTWLPCRAPGLLFL
jgi:hypothetical protein